MAAAVARAVLLLRVLLRLRKLLLRLLVLLLRRCVLLRVRVRHFRCSGERARRGGDDDEECDARARGGQRETQLEIDATPRNGSYALPLRACSYALPICLEYERPLHRLERDHLRALDRARRRRLRAQDGPPPPRLPRRRHVGALEGHRRRDDLPPLQRPQHADSGDGALAVRVEDGNWSILNWEAAAGNTAARRIPAAEAAEALAVALLDLTVERMISDTRQDLWWR